MSTVTGSSQGRWGRGRIAAAVTAVGALIFSSGIVMITVPAANASADKIGVCHRQANGAYKYIEVSKNAAGGPRGHDTHLEGGSSSVPGSPDYILTSLGVPSWVTTPALFITFCRGLNGSTESDVELDPVEFTANGGCGVRGSIVRPVLDGVTFEIGGGDWNVTEGTHTITAGTAGNVRFVEPAPDGWDVANSGKSATFEVVLGAYAGDCATGSLGSLGVTRVAGCGTYGSITPPASPVNVAYSIDRGGQWTGLSGSYVVRATLTNGATSFAGSTADWTVTGTTATQTVNVGTFQACSQVTGSLGQLSVTQVAGCGTYGAITPPASPVNVTYSISGGQWNGLSGSYVVTATLTNGATSFAGSTAEWTVTDTTASRTVNVGSFVACQEIPPGSDPVVTDTVVSPLAASVIPATCSADGSLDVPTQPNGVNVAMTGAAPGLVTVSFSPASGFAFPSGTETQRTFDVPAQLTGSDCILGEETSRPKPKPRDEVKKPNRGPVVLGTHAAVPTAVAAGFGGAPPHVVSSDTSLVAQALIVGGLLLLVSGGTIGLGRRTRGAREA